MPSKSQFVAEARSWKGTKFAHQHAHKGIFTDCVGLATGSLINVGWGDFWQMPGAWKYKGYGSAPNGKIKPACDELLIPRSQAEMCAGDIILVAVARDPQHLAILFTYPDPVIGGFAIVHAACGSDGKGSVIESRLVFGSSMKFVAAYSVPGLTDE